LLVTIPPLQMRNNVATHVIHAKTLSQPIDLEENVRFISLPPIANPINRGLRG